MSWQTQWGPAGKGPVIRCNAAISTRSCRVRQSGSSRLHVFAWSSRCSNGRAAGANTSGYGWGTFHGCQRRRENRGLQALPGRLLEQPAELSGGFGMEPEAAPVFGRRCCALSRRDDGAGQVFVLLPLAPRRPQSRADIIGRAVPRFDNKELPGGSARWQTVARAGLLRFYRLPTMKKESFRTRRRLLFAPGPPKLLMPGRREGARSPNVVFYFAETTWAIPIWVATAGDIEKKTPNLDRLAKNGLRFTQFTTRSRCWGGGGHFARAVLCFTRLYGAKKIRPRHVFRASQRRSRASAGSGARLSCPTFPEAARFIGSTSRAKFGTSTAAPADGFDRSYDPGRFRKNRLLQPPKLISKDEQAPLPSVENPQRLLRGTTAIGPFHAIKCLNDHAAKTFPTRAVISVSFAFTAPAFSIAGTLQKGTCSLPAGRYSSRVGDADGAMARLAEKWTAFSWLDNKV